MPVDRDVTDSDWGQGDKNNTAEKHWNCRSSTPSGLKGPFHPQIPWQSLGILSRLEERLRLAKELWDKFQYLGQIARARLRAVLLRKGRGGLTEALALHPLLREGVHQRNGAAHHHRSLGSYGKHTFCILDETSSSVSGIDECFHKTWQWCILSHPCTIYHLNTYAVLS